MTEARGQLPPARKRPVTVDDVPFSALHEQERHEVVTADGWTLVVTRYRPIPQDFPQPIFGQPLLLVHGFAQNRRAWTSGDFIKNMLFFGADLHLLELRGHGKSSVSLQKRRTRAAGLRPPADLAFDWDIDSYFLYDVPAAVAHVRRLTGRDRIFYVGHSMGGMLGYGYAGLHPEELAGLVAIGAPSDLGRGFFALRMLAQAGRMIPLLDAILWAASALKLSGWQTRDLAHRLLEETRLERWAPSPGRRPRPWRFRAVPVDALLRTLERLLTDRRYATLTRLAPHLTFLVNPERATIGDVRWLLREGGDREPRRVVEQFARWIRNDELVCYRTGYDFKRSFPKISIPLAIIFGDRDWLAGVEATRSVYYAARSEYLLWRPVKGNSHVELTMGSDIRQICYDIKNLVDYSISHVGRPPTLPRRGA